MIRNDPEWDKHYKNISNENWKKLFEESVDYWDKLDDVIKDDEKHFETDTCPMHPSLFFELISVVGFNKVNGYTYKDYVSKWRNRRGEGFTQHHFVG